LSLYRSGISWNSVSCWTCGVLSRFDLPEVSHEI